jgi:hypothetical protein
MAKPWATLGFDLLVDDRAGPAQRVEKALPNAVAIGAFRVRMVPSGYSRARRFGPSKESSGASTCRFLAVVERSPHGFNVRIPLISSHHLRFGATGD